MSGRNESSTARRADDDEWFFIIQRPAAHEGVGRALRSVYRKDDDGVPADIAALIGKLDGIRL